MSFFSIQGANIKEIESHYYQIGGRDFDLKLLEYLKKECYFPIDNIIDFF